MSKKLKHQEEMKNLGFSWKSILLSAIVQLINFSYFQFTNKYVFKSNL